MEEMAKQANGLATKILISMIVLGIGAACTAWGNHILSPGHPVVLEKVDRLHSDVAEIKRDVKTLLQQAG